MNEPTLNPPTAPTAVLSAQAPRYMGPGVVVDAGDSDSDHLRVVLPTGGDPVRAELAAPGAGALRRGQRVLVSVSDAGAAYVIGVLDGGRRRLDTRRGASAQVVADGDGERLEVRDPEGALVFSYDPEGGRTLLNVPRGNLDVQASDGDLTLRAGGAVRLTGRSIDLAATSAIRAFVHGASARVATALRLGHRTARVDADTFRVETRHARVNAARTRLRSDRIDTEADEIHTTARRIRTTAEAVTQRFGSLCRRVKGLVESRAGRVRTLISGSWRARARRADLRTEETFKVDGRKIHLG